MLRRAGNPVSRLSRLQYQGMGDQGFGSPIYKLKMVRRRSDYYSLPPSSLQSPSTSPAPINQTLLSAIMRLLDHLPALVAGLLTVTVTGVHATPTPTTEADIVVGRQVSPIKNYERMCNLTGLGPTDWKADPAPGPLLSDCLQIENTLKAGAFSSSERWTVTYPIRKGGFGTCRIGLLVRSPKPEPPERAVFYYGDGDLSDFLHGSIERFTDGDRVKANSALFHCQFSPERPIMQVEFFLWPYIGPQDT